MIKKLGLATIIFSCLLLMFSGLDDERFTIALLGAWATLQAVWLLEI